MSREKAGQKQSSTLSARATYELLLESGYSPKLVNPHKPLQSLKWDVVIRDPNVVHSQSGKSIILMDTTDQGRPLFDLKIKGMMSERSVAFFKTRALSTPTPS